MASLDELLQKTSRTFALAIPLLPEKERQEVTLGYLVFRIADTLEDADTLSRDDRIEALIAFKTVLGEFTPAAAVSFRDQWAPRRLTNNPDYQELLEHTPEVMAALGDCPTAVREIVVSHAQRSIDGMAATLGRASSEGAIQCQSIDELRRYCYYVAGIVGELLTDLFELRLPSDRDRSLQQEARWFGEGLQLVNILKDAADDAQAGRTYLPVAVPLEEVFSIAHEDLARAARYIDHLRGLKAPPGYIAFTRAPRELAMATLAKLQAEGPGAKVTRPEVGEILQSVQEEFSSADSGLGLAEAGGS